VVARHPPLSVQRIRVPLPGCLTILGLATVVLFFPYRLVGAEQPTPERAESHVQTTQPELPSPKLELYKEAVVDTPAKTQVFQHFVASQLLSEGDLRSELVKLFRAAGSRRGFKYNNPPSRVAVYVYSSDEQARAGLCCWIGMAHGGMAEQPDMVVNAERIAALGSQNKTRAGLPSGVVERCTSLLRGQNGKRQATPRLVRLVFDSLSWKSNQSNVIGNRYEGSTRCRRISCTRCSRRDLQRVGTRRRKSPITPTFQVEAFVLPQNRSVSLSESAALGETPSVTAL
jgi:hypothetical protein